MKKDIASIFNKFAGREVPMIEEEITGCFGSGEAFTLVELANPNDPTIKAIKKVAADNGLKLRLQFPGVSITKEYRDDRVNAFIEKASDGKWRISNRFEIG